MRLIKYIIAIGLIYYFKLYDLEHVKAILKNHELLKKLIIGGSAYTVLYFLFIKRWQNFTHFKTHTHELTHSIAAMVTSKKIHQLAANEKDGHVLFSGNESWFVTLTPYFLPIYTLLLFPIRFFIEPSSIFWFDSFLIFLYAYHLDTFAGDFSFKQPDIKKNGFFFSTIYVLVGNLFFFLLFAAMMVMSVK